MAHFEELVEKLRTDVAAFGKAATELDGVPLPLDTSRLAEDAMRRAAGALAFANPDEPAVRELRMLYEAVAPIVLPANRLGSATGPSL